MKINNIFNIILFLTITVSGNFLFPMKNSNYLPSVGGADRLRLEIINERYNPISSELLVRNGLKEGMKVLDMGCGQGYMSCEIAEMVGDEGYVIGIDNSSDQLEIARNVVLEKELHNLKFIELSVYNLDDGSLEEEGIFDIIFCRFLLLHLKDVKKVLQDAYSLLKPGGKFVLFETLGCETIHSEPPTKELETFVKMGRLQFSETDDSIGSKLPSILEEIGCEDVCYEERFSELEGPRHKSLLSLAVDTLTPKMLEIGSMTKGELEDLKSGLLAIEKNDSIKVYYFGDALVSATKPE